MKRIFESPVWCGILTLALAAILFGVRIDLPFLEPEEALYAEIPRQMLARDRVLVPIHNGDDYLDKPPLLYWLAMASYRAFGVHEWSARLPTILASWLTIAIALAWGWRIAGPWVGVAAALVLTLFGDFTYRAPMLTMNGPLAMFVTLSLAAGHQAIHSERLRWRWWLTSAIACGLGILTKGPVAGALIAVPLFIWPWLDRRLERPSWLAWSTWIVMSAAIAGPWFVAVAWQRPAFVEYFFWKHHVERFATPFDHAGPVWQYVPQLALGFMPWTLVAAWLAWRRPSRTEEGGSLARLSLVAALWGFAFFSLAGSKRPVYLVAIEPIFAVAAGAWFWSVRTSLSKPLWFGLGAMTALVLGAGIVAWLPAYSRDHSVAAAVREVKDVPPSVPVFCYGHGWNAVGFYLERDDVRDFVGERRGAIVHELEKAPRSLVFVSNRDFESILPATLRFRVVAECRLARVGFVTSEP